MKRILVVASLLTVVAAAGLATQSADLASEGRSWLAHVRFLADDGLEGRNVGTPGFEKAAEYVESQFRAIGLKPAGVNGFRQPVQLESRQLVPADSSLALVRDGRETPLVIGQDASISARGELNGTLEAPMVFVGYGLSIPEAGWDDFAGVDLGGKIAVYVNAFPPVTVSDNVRSHVNNATERWLALKRAGAIGVATVSVPRPSAGGGAPAGRGGGRGGRGGGAPPPVITLADPEVNDVAGQKVSLSFTARGAAMLFEGASHSLDEIAQLLADDKPLPRFALPGTLKAQVALERDIIDSANIVGLVAGSDPALESEYVVMTAHLDHVGVGRAVNGDSIYNGAMDDASGVASVIETARLLAASGVRTKRSVLFVVVTAEEKGLLGSRYFAGKPTVPIDRIVADINLDMFLPLYPLKVIEVQGLAESSLGETVKAAAATLGVEVQSDREPEQNRFIRSDQYSFIRKGVPALAFKFGYEFGSPEETIRRTWVRDVYHTPADDANQPIDLEAAATFNRVIMTLLQRVANDPARPTWNDDSFFKRFATSPETSPGVPSQEPDALPPSVLSVVRDGYVSEFAETRYFDASADLNGDGRAELIVYVVGPMACGTGGCPTLVFTPGDGMGYRLVTTISITRTPVRMSAQTTNGWRNLIVHVAGGGATPHDAELEFDGRTYPTNPSVPPARPAPGYEGAVVLIPDFESLSQGKIVK